MGHWFYITPEEYAAAAEIGIKPVLLDFRIRQYGWDKQRAMTTPPRKRTDHSKWWPVMEKHGVPRQTYLNRISRGWDPERAATEPLLSQKQRAVRLKRNNPAKRVYPQELIESAERNGISRNLFTTRVTKLKWSWERAASEPPVPTKERGRRGIQTLKQQRGDINALIFQKRG